MLWGHACWCLCCAAAFSVVRSTPCGVGWWAPAFRRKQTFFCSALWFRSFILCVCPVDANPSHNRGLLIPLFEVQAQHEDKCSKLLGTHCDKQLNTMKQENTIAWNYFIFLRKSLWIMLTRGVLCVVWQWKRSVFIQVTPDAVLLSKQWLSFCSALQCFTSAPGTATRVAYPN